MEHGEDIKGVNEFMKPEPVSLEQSGGKVVAGEKKEADDDESPKAPKLKVLRAGGDSEPEEADQRSAGEKLGGKMTKGKKGTGLAGFPTNDQKNFKKTDGGAEYLCKDAIEGTDIGDIKTAIVRLDGGAELT